jgi:hypothetical protein
MPDGNFFVCSSVSVSVPMCEVCMLDVRGAAHVSGGLLALDLCVSLCVCVCVCGLCVIFLTSLKSLYDGYYQFVDLRKIHGRIRRI